MPEPVTVSTIIAGVAEVILQVMADIGAIESMFEKMPGPEQQMIMRMHKK